MPIYNNQNNTSAHTDVGEIEYPTLSECPQAFLMVFNTNK